MDTHYPALAGVFSRKGSGVSAMIVVYVLAPDRTPLMPCTPVVARLLLKDGKAKVLQRTPFTIKLLTQPEESCTHHLSCAGNRNL